MTYMILITMVFADPLKHLSNAIIVNQYQNQPLLFKTQEECFEHVNRNVVILKEFARKQYPEGEASVKDINCVEKKFIDDMQRIT